MIGDMGGEVPSCIFLHVSHYGRGPGPADRTENWAIVSQGIVCQEEGTRESWREIRVGWLVGGKSRKMQEKRRGIEGFQGGKDGVVGEGEVRCPPHILVSILCIPYKSIIPGKLILSQF